MEGSSPTWDASHPAKHTDLFLPADMDLRRTRVRTTRIAKLVNDRYTNWSFSSFNLAALAYFGIEQPQSLDKALLEFYVFAAKDLRDQLTPDPAGVSDSIKLPKGVTKDKAVKRFEKKRDLMEEAVEADSDEEAREALAKLLPDWVEPPEGGAASLAASIAAGDCAPRNRPRRISRGHITGTRNQKERPVLRRREMKWWGRSVEVPGMGTNALLSCLNKEFGRRTQDSMPVDSFVRRVSSTRAGSR